MKTIKQVLSECPKHDCAYVLYDGRWHRIEEHELRAIQLAIAKGELNNSDVRIKLTNGYEPKWLEEGDGGPWRLESIHQETNIFTLSATYAIQCFKAENDRRIKQ